MLSENIKRLRMENNLTQSQLAEQLHVVRQTVSKWENGSSVPDALMLQKLAEVLQTDINTLLDAPLPTPKPTRPLATTTGKTAFALTVFFGLCILLLTPLNTPIKSYEGFGFLSPIAVYLLYMSRIYLATPMLFACGTFLLLYLFRTQTGTAFRLPAFVGVIGFIMLCMGLYCSANCILLNNLPLPRGWGMQILNHAYYLTLWQIAAACLMQLSSKEKIT